MITHKSLLSGTALQVLGRTDIGKLETKLKDAKVPVNSVTKKGVENRKIIITGSC